MNHVGDASVVVLGKAPEMTPLTCIVHFFDTCHFWPLHEPPTNLGVAYSFTKQYFEILE